MSEVHGVSWEKDGSQVAQINEESGCTSKWGKVGRAI